ncbi:MULTISPECIES: hypothetical protein [Roseicella]|uniref:Uncharacterized protein n=1 Tax=Roseicella aquatilis TaxID=2527868 RepID=A0A4R4D8U7_9PROT|nr:MULTISPECIES: hypothetical protein [Roseicella]NOG73579.1 hypothetical protein [Roseicella sp. DB1501]TCZ55801.1 hypothetical protein EXY23_20955 [Roseicella aquatilis]
MQDISLSTDAINKATEAFYKTIVEKYGEPHRFDKHRMMGSRPGSYLELYNRELFGRTLDIPALPQTVGQLAERLEALCQAVNRQVKKHPSQYRDGDADREARFTQPEEAKDLAKQAARAAMEAALQSLQQAQEQAAHQVVDLREALPSTSLNARTATHEGSPGATPDDGKPGPARS